MNEDLKAGPRPEEGTRATAQQKIQDAVDAVNELAPGRERVLVITKLDEAALWLTRAVE